MMGSSNLERNHHYVGLYSAGFVEVSSMFFAICQLFLVFDHRVRIHHSVGPFGGKQFCTVAFLGSCVL